VEGKIMTDQTKQMVQALAIIPIVYLVTVIIMSI